MMNKMLFAAVALVAGAAGAQTMEPATTTTSTTTATAPAPSAPAPSVTTSATKQTTVTKPVPEVHATTHHSSTTTKTSPDGVYYAHGHWMKWQSLRHQRPGRSAQASDDDQLDDQHLDEQLTHARLFGRRKRFGPICVRPRPAPTVRYNSPNARKLA